MDNNQIVEAVNSLNATVRRLIFAFECDRGLEMGRNGYYKKHEAREDYFALRYGEPEDPEEQEILDFISSKASKAERKAFFEKQIAALEAN